MAQHGKQWKCKDCGFSNFSFRTVCRRCAEAKRWGDPPPEPLPLQGGPRTPVGRWAEGPPPTTKSYALEVVKKAFGQEWADRLKTADEKTKEADDRPDITAMVAAAEHARKQFGDAAAAPLDALVKEARRKRDDAKKPHLRVRDAEAREESAKKAMESAQKERYDKQKALEAAEEGFKAAEAKHTAAKAELAEVKAAAYRDVEVETSQKERTKGAHDALARMRSSLRAVLSEDQAAELAAIEAALPPVPLPPPPSPQDQQAGQGAAGGAAAGRPS